MRVRQGNKVVQVPILTGNKEMAVIGQAVGAQMFGSNSIDQAFNYLLQKLDTNGDHIYNPGPKGDKKEDIAIFGHSWGGYSAIHLAQKIDKSDKFCNKEIKVLAVMDPVRTARGFLGVFAGSYGVVPKNVDYFWNRYQTGNRQVTAVIIAPHGWSVRSDAKVSDQKDLNPPPGTSTFSYPSKLGDIAVPITHWSIVTMVAPEIEDVLKN